MARSEVPTAGLFGLALLALAGIALPSATGIETAGGISRGEMVGPGAFPQVYLWLIAITGALLLASDARPILALRRPPFRLAARLLAMSFGLVAYVVGLRLLGFLVPTLAFQFVVLSVGFCRRGPLWLVLVPVGLTTLVIAIFSGLMAVPLPRGTGWIYGLNRMIY
ncbi:MAG: tripartite tricarboxylate transporter TctB family protein [Pseudomonadota bacterium]